MVRDAIWTDFNNDNQIDIIVVGEWMKPTFLQNSNGVFKDRTIDYGKRNYMDYGGLLSPLILIRMAIMIIF